MTDRPAAIESFSSAYFVIDGVDVVHPYSGDSVVAANDFYNELNQHVARPLVRVGDSYEWVRPEWGVPPHTFAVPGDIDYRDESILLAKTETVYNLHEQGAVGDP